MIAYTENKFSNCFQFLIFTDEGTTQLLHIPVAFSCLFSPLLAHFLLTTAKTISILQQLSHRLHFGTHHLSTYNGLQKMPNPAPCAILQKSAIILYLYFTSTQNQPEWLMLFQEFTVKHMWDVTMGAAHRRNQEVLKA